MVKFKLISLVDGFYHYEIYPEGKKEGMGCLIFNPETKEVKKKLEPAGSFDYFGHFLQGIKDKDGNYKKSGMVAWY
ncbi:MAG: hypothetical protein PUG50_01830 [Eubacteriales bacterium]|uniref:hypothetical protein n=1 Tax=Fenollaria sp. TaxID=1965292 RepID=UPI002A74CDC2|nr:hypothetical protein [Fenollaria sp.]MDD7339308.1 hypothetical protein [Eubacteriales bacterium]MDY3105889.1 hypothetical protein [Fenollaria sp.]